MKADKITGQKFGAWAWGRMGEGERERKKGKGEKWGKLQGVGWLRWRKGGYGSRKEDTLIKRAIFGLARDLTLEGFPGVQGDVPS